MGAPAGRRGNGAVPLRRLLDRSLVAALVDSAAAAEPRGRVALAEIDGTLFVGELDASARVAASLRRVCAGEAQAWVRIAGGMRVHALRVRGQSFGCIAIEGPVVEPAIEVLRQALEAMLVQAVDLRVLGRETLDRYHEINLLYRVGETIGASIDAADIPGLLLAETSRAIASDAAVVLIGHSRVVGAALGRTEDVDYAVAASRDLVDTVMDVGRPSSNALPAAGAGGLDTVIGVPIRGRDERFGVVVLARRDGRAPFTAGDLKLLLAIAGEAGVAYDRARHHEQEIQRERLDEELAVGRRMQLSLLPASVPTVTGWDFAAVYEAARQVGGDFYDFLSPRGGSGSIDLVIGDVTGKGVPAALLMAFTRAVLRASAVDSSSPSEVLTRTNRQVISDGRAGLFVTALYATLDLGSGDVVIASGGHDPPLWVTGAGHRTRLVTSRSSILGAFQEIDVEDRRIRLEAGDVLVLYTDGVTEARDAQRRLFGERRLRSVAAAHAGSGAAAIASAIHDAVRAFAGPIPMSDDLTLVVVKRTGTTTN